MIERVIAVNEAIKWSMRTFGIVKIHLLDAYVAGWLECRRR